ncbi:MAG: DUF4145 domain-containing protein [Lutibacter sp.]|nr:DUF4145 domain-containing protein [Lutibacter sp.]
MIKINWLNIGKIPSKNYKCGHCGNSLATELGYTGTILESSHNKMYIYICHFCTRPTFFDSDNKQIPGAKIGNAIKHIINQDIEMLFHEANDCFTIGAYTSSVICCRKLLMNISVEQGAKEGLGFVQYVSYLNDNNFIPPNGKNWVDSIRKLGNEANHRIDFKTQNDAKLIITFTEMLLRFIYEMPGLMKESMEIEVIDPKIE